MMTQKKDAAVQTDLKNTKDESTETEHQEPEKGDVRIVVVKDKEPKNDDDDDFCSYMYIS